MENKTRARQRPDSEGVKLRHSVCGISWGYLTWLILGTVSWLPRRPRLELSHGMVVLSGKKLGHTLPYRWRCRKALDPLPLPWWIFFGWLGCRQLLRDIVPALARNILKAQLHFSVWGWIGLLGFWVLYTNKKNHFFITWSHRLI